MTEEGFDYTLGLKDGVSGPAKDEVTSLKALQGQITETEKAMRRLQAEQLNYRRGGFKGAASDVGLEIAQIRHHLGGLKSAAGEAKSEVGSAAHETAVGFIEGGIVLEGIERAVDAVKEMGAFAIESQEFKHNTILAYQAVQGTAEEGEKTFEQLDAMAQRVHMPAQQAHNLARDLMLQGLEDTKLIGATIGAEAALMRTGQIQGAEKLKSIIEKSLASGHFDAGKGLAGGKGGAASGRSLAGLGVHLPDLMKDLAARTGKSLAQVKQMLKQGKIDTETGVAALVDAINTGVVGKTAAAKYDIEDLTTDIKNSFEEAAQSVDFGEFDRQLKNIDDDFKRISGHSFFDIIVKGAGMAIEAVDQFVIEAGTEFIKLQLYALKTQHFIRDLFGGGPPIKEPAAIERTLDAGRANFNRVYDERHKTGSEQHVIMTGGEVKKVHFDDDSFTKVGEQAGKAGIKGVRKASKTHSPSDEMKDVGRDWKDVGRDWADGLAIGFGQGPSPMFASSAGSSGRSVHVDVGGIHIHGGQRDSGELTEIGIADAFERIALELGQ